ncbi:GATA transcription factor 8 [Nicotiana tabacum]|uniref:GATA transcription factor n=3 Tax=Nicotiana TaxID=4085 RepID=A0A1S4AA63_TOBAC|nr:PREDICTED: GATA transcription factor 8-like [Nicotiana sylvestris]XP_009802379.1 PREDICTED: GATA transcription factor 8-like [Nicotiana sylvestris]XP_016473478.1 PREDICTED: GATA transcription factor 8-like [Nicotiana tabacum]XP_016473479.1 PREDICTED: GATA transcription factor 8-like [Nicotiana tabacum]
MGSSLVDEIDCASFFDHMDDLIEFSPENECGDLDSTDCKNFPSICNEPLPDSDPLFFSSHRNSPSDFSSELLVPYEDIVQLEWLSTFVEDSFSCGGLTMGKEHFPVNKEPSHNKFLSSSPVSVLESSSSSSSSSGAVKTTPPLSPCHRGTQRARSKRPRPATFNPRLVSQLMSPTSSFTEIHQQFVAPEDTLESDFGESPMKKKKRIKFSIPLAPVDTNRNYQRAPQTVRKCVHCEITKTPQWRAGPMGPKTLCNACGVRYKKGRLFPEYRPAAAPTFVPSLHSNSHKKVLEMRSNVFPEDTHDKQAAPCSIRPLSPGPPESNATAGTSIAQSDFNPE